MGQTPIPVGSMNHLAFHIPPERFDEYRQRLIGKGVEVGPVLNHDESESQVAVTLHDGVYIRSFYFYDPDGIMLEFACWTREFTESDATAVPQTAAERHPRPAGTSLS
jgi:catechol 2,3-dioxygenase-like lactoylglutathione lyase family enzyme